MKHQFNRRLFLQHAAALTLAGVGGVRAQAAFPSRPIRIVVPLPAGGTADASVRMLGEQLTALTGQSVIVENKPGAIF